MKVEEDLFFLAMLLTGREIFCGSVCFIEYADNTHACACHPSHISFCYITYIISFEFFFLHVRKVWGQALYKVFIMLYFVLLIIYYMSNQNSSC